MKATSNGRLRAAMAALMPAVLMLAIGCGKQDSGKANAAAPPAAVPVTVASVEQRDVPLEVKAIGNVEAINSVAVKSQISGQIIGVHFKEGQDVKRGELLFEIDPRPFQADLSKAEATLAKDVADAANNRVQAERYGQLAKEGVVSKQQNDAAQAAAQASDASVAADKAAIESSKVQLHFTKLTSPIDGRTGNLAVNNGNVVKANDVPMVTINQISPIYVAFSIPEQQLADVKQRVNSGLKVAASLQGQANQQVEGKLTFIDNAVDLTTGTIKLKATFPNSDRKLWPGQFVDVVLTLATQPNAIVIPSQAIQNSQQGQYVYVVKPDMTADLRPVKVARTLNNMTIISDGLQAGEKVVTDGQIRLTKGTHVEIKQAVARTVIIDPSAQAD